MSLVTKPKRKPPIHTKKRLGQHHRLSKHYVKAYWPYIPALLIIVGGFWVNGIWTVHSSILGSANTGLYAASKPVSRIQLLTGSHAVWSVVLLSFISGAAATLYIVQNSIRLRKLVRESEVYVSNHPFMDILVVFIAVAGFVLTRTNAIIH